MHRLMLLLKAIIVKTFDITEYFTDPKKYWMNQQKRCTSCLRNSRNFLKCKCPKSS